MLGVLDRYFVWWFRWACFDGEGRIGRASEMVIYKSADECIVDFAEGGKGVGFIVFISEWITAGVRSIVGGRLTTAARLLSVTLCFADTLGCLDCYGKKM